jgi:hypothetical protein
LKEVQYNLYRGKKTGGLVRMNPDGTIDTNYKDPSGVGRIMDKYYKGSSYPIYNNQYDNPVMDDLILQYPELKNMLKTGKGRRVKNPKYKGDIVSIPKGEMDGLNGYGRPGADGHGIRKIGGKKPSARGAIVKRIMKEKNLSLPMASKYVKEHGLY